jgi:hypothetical protein
VQPCLANKDVRFSFACSFTLVPSRPAWRSPWLYGLHVYIVPVTFCAVYRFYCYVMGCGYS